MGQCEAPRKLTEHNSIKISVHCYKQKAKNLHLGNYNRRKLEVQSLELAKTLGGNEAEVKGLSLMSTETLCKSTFTPFSYPTTTCMGDIYPN